MSARVVSDVESQTLWAKGDSYEHLMGRWSRAVARPFLKWLACPGGWRWLDVGCGTGALSEAILSTQRPDRLLGVDSSAEFVAAARNRLDTAIALFEIGDAGSLPASDGEFNAAVSGLVLNFVPEPARMLAEMRRAVAPGGTVGLYVWDYAGGMQLARHFWDAAAALDAKARERDGAVRFPVCRPEALTGLFGGAGLEEVETRAIDVPTVFRDFEDYWSPFLGGQGPMGSYCASLGEAERAALRERLRAALPADADGGIALTARAWAVKGTAPG